MKKIKTEKRFEMPLDGKDALDWLKQNYIPILIGIFIGIIIQWILVTLLAVGIVYGIYKLVQKKKLKVKI